MESVERDASAPDLKIDTRSGESSEAGMTAPAALFPSDAGPVPASATRPSPVLT